jgi:hypothetical protein
MSSEDFMKSLGPYALVLASGSSFSFALSDFFIILH